MVRWITRLATLTLSAVAAAQAPTVPVSLPATPSTVAANHAAAARLPPGGEQLVADAQRGLIAAWDPSANAGIASPSWTLQGFEFLADVQPADSVHPLLWRHARTNLAAGLFRVTERVFQLRGLDISNITVIEGDTGLIVIDTLLTAEAAQAAMNLYFAHRPRRPVVAVIYTHSHADHFGGVRGIVDEDAVRAGKVRILAPDRFNEEAASENVLAGAAMFRRTHFQFGPLLPRGPRGLVDVGLGKAASASGTTTLISPTQLLREPVETHRIDGVEIVFALTPGSEAPSGLILYLPQFRVLDMGEIATQNLHNFLPLRGAQVRDSLAWAKQIDAALQRFGDTSDVLIAQHHWPVWGGDALRGFLERQRDTYRFIHDQTLHGMNRGYTAAEIAERLRLPEELQADSASHGLYGSLKHNVKAVYQRYLGWYDGHPANLDPMPPAVEAARLIEYMGGTDVALARARRDFESGDYRIVARVASMAVMAEPDNGAARELAGAALEQLGYQAESATFRNAYLQGARELRQGPPRLPRTAGSARPDLVRALTLPQYFDYLAMRLDADRAAGQRLQLLWRFTDSGDVYHMNLMHSVLNTRAVQATAAPPADAELTLTRAEIDEITLGRTDFPRAVAEGRIRVSGDRERVLALLSWLEEFPNDFPVMTPRTP